MISNATYTDIPIDGGFTPQGDIILLYEGDAISNSLKAFLTGAYPDLFDLNKKGVLRRFINKPLDSDTAQDISTAVKSSIENDFTPQLIVQSLQVIPDFEESEWLISFVGSTVDTFTTVTLNQRILAVSKGVFNG